MTHKNHHFEGFIVNFGLLSWKPTMITVYHHFVTGTSIIKHNIWSDIKIPITTKCVVRSTSNQLQNHQNNPKINIPIKKKISIKIFLLVCNGNIFHWFYCYIIVSTPLLMSHLGYALYQRLDFWWTLSADTYSDSEVAFSS